MSAIGRRVLLHGALAEAVFLPALCGGGRIDGSRALLLAAFLAGPLLLAIASGDVRSDGEEPDNLQETVAMAVVVVLLLVALFFPTMPGWTAPRVLLGIAGLLGAGLASQHWRALHLTATGMGALAATALDSSTCWTLAIAGAGILAAAGLDRLEGKPPETSVSRVEAGPTTGRFIVRWLTAITLIWSGVLLLLFRLLPPGRGAAPTRVVAAPRVGPRVDWRSLPLGHLAAMVAVVLVFLWLARRLLRRGGMKSASVVPEEEAMEKRGIAPLGRPRPARPASPPPASPRRELVGCYLGHLARLARFGFDRETSETPREFSRQLEGDCAETGGALRELEERIAALFERGRYGPEIPGPELVREMAERARDVEERLQRRRDEGRPRSSG